jgi:hypothetical protein
MRMKGFGNDLDKRKLVAIVLSDWSMHAVLPAAAGFEDPKRVHEAMGRHPRLSRATTHPSRVLLEGIEVIFPTNPPSVHHPDVS